MKAGDVGRQHHIMKLLIMKWSDCAVKKKNRESELSGKRASQSNF